MDDKPTSGATWADVVNQIVNSFLVLRDIFGYALPGLVLLGIGVAAGQIKLAALEALLLPYAPPWWALTALLVAAAYAVGHILAAIAYLRIDIWKAILQKRGKTAELQMHPTEVNPKDLFYQHFYPRLLAEKNRRETMAVLNFSLMAALLLGWVVFCYWKPSLCQLLVAAGLILFAETLTTMSHLKRVRQAIHIAGADIAEREEGHGGAAVSPDLKAALDAIQQSVEKLGKRQ